MVVFGNEDGLDLHAPAESGPALCLAYAYAAAATAAKELARLVTELTTSSCDGELKCEPKSSQPSRLFSPFRPNPNQPKMPIRFESKPFSALPPARPTGHSHELKKKLWHVF